jgi:site-specific DNA recombinase
MHPRIAERWQVVTRRCAIYARYSSDLQRESSIEDQIRRCREYAQRQGWNVIEPFVRVDRAISAASIAGRDALQQLVKAAKDKNREFDCLLIDDTSRLARDLSDALRTFKILEFHHVTVVSVSQGIDSSQGNARPLLAMHGIMDEQYLTDLAAKVHRGQEGRALHGYTTGGRVYGYNNVPVEDPSRTGKYGRAAVLGVELEINPKQAAVVRRIFTMYAEGTGQATIAVQLNAEGIPGPNGFWSKYTIHEMLRNERYGGVFVWGRTKKSRNPETGRKVSRATPESQWRRVDAPNWRIVPEELWHAVQERRRSARESFHRKGGMTRTQRARSYLFSGVLVCGQCGGSVVICAGGGKRGYVKYGCHTHKQSGICGNKLMIRQDRLEGQLLAAIQQRILKPVTLDHLIARCEEELRMRLADIARQGTVKTVDALKKDLEDRKRRRSKVLEAIETAGDIDSLTDRLRELETDIKGIEAAITAYRPLKLDQTVADVREHIANALSRLQESLTSGGEADLSRAKAALAKHVGRLVLTPTSRDGRPVYKVTGSLSVDVDAEKCRMQLVARDGFEPPTPAFSGLRSTPELPGHCGGEISF